MAGAMTAGMAGLFISAASSIFTGVQGYYSGKAQEEIFEQSAGKTEIESQAAANRIRARARRVAATQRARAAAGGIDLTDSVVDIQYDSAVQSEIDAMQELYSGSIQAADLRARGSTAAKSGRTGLITSGLGAAGTVLGGIGQYNALKNNPTAG